MYIYVFLIATCMHKLTYTYIFLAECGLAPHVTINCTDGGSAHVDWATSCKDQFDCKAYWNCTNGRDHHHEEVFYFVYLCMYIATYVCT